MTVTARLALLLLATVANVASAEAPAMKAPPTRPPLAANVVVQRLEVLDDCSDEKICLEGTLLNNGAKPAYHVLLRVEIGGTQNGHPRTTVEERADESMLVPSETSAFSFALPRRLSYRVNGKEKWIDVGRYNFHIVPVWSAVEKPAVTKGPVTRKKRR